MTARRMMSSSEAQPGTCRECGEPGTPNGVSHQCMAVRNFTDLEGRIHLHDPNTHGSTYRCVNGHRWHQRWIRQCWCGWDNGGPQGEAYEQVEAAHAET